MRFYLLNWGHSEIKWVENGCGNEEKASRSTTAVSSFCTAAATRRSKYDRGMNDRKLYEQILGIAQPWYVDEVTLRLEKGEIEVHVRGSAAVEKCPECGKPCP